MDTEAFGRVRLQAALEKVFHMLAVLGPDRLAEVKHVTYIAIDRFLCLPMSDAAGNEDVKNDSHAPYVS